MRVAYKIEFNHFAQIAARLPGAVAEEVERAAFAIEGDAKVRCPVDTGNLRSSISAERTRNDGLQWRVGTGVEYAEFVEYGVRSKPGYPVQPYLTPAAEAEKPRFVEALRDLERSL